MSRYYSNMEPVWYVYNAGLHCPEHAEWHFGRDRDGFITGTDSEGNAVGAIFSWDDDAKDGYCAECVYESVLLRSIRARKRASKRSK